MSGQAICKDCGNGTLNNAVNAQFELGDDSAYCLRCGSSHIDGELYLDNSEVELEMV